MEERPVILTFETAKTMYESKDEVLMAIASKTFPELLNSDFPKSWEELCELKKGEEGYCITAAAIISSTEFSTKSQYSGTVSTKERVETMLLLQQLLEIRDEWNKIDKFIPDYKGGHTNYCVVLVNEKLSSITCVGTYCLFAFKNMKRVELFIETFKKELKQVLAV